MCKKQLAMKKIFSLSFVITLLCSINFLAAMSPEESSDEHDSGYSSDSDCSGSAFIKKRCRVAPNADEQEYSLSQAIDTCNISWLEGYVAAGGDVNEFLSPDAYAHHPLHRAICPLQRAAAMPSHAQRAEVLELLLKNRAHIDVCNFFGETAVHLAIAANSPDALKILLAHGADWTRTAMIEKTPEQTIDQIAQKEVAPLLRTIIHDHEAAQRIAYQKAQLERIAQARIVPGGVDGIIAGYAVPNGPHELHAYQMMLALRAAQRASAKNSSIGQLRMPFGE